MRNLSLEAYDGLVNAVYDSATHPERWDQFLSRLSRRFANARTSLHCDDRETGLNFGIVGANYDPHFVGMYAREFASLNPWIKGQARGRVGRAQVSEALVPRNELVRTRFYDEWVRPQEDVGTGAGITICKNPRRFLRLSCNIRFRDADRTQADLVHALNALAPHLRRAFAISRHLHGRSLLGGLRAVLDTLPSAVVLLDRRGRVRYANRAAEALRSEGVLLAFDRNGKLSFNDPRANRAMAVALGVVAQKDFRRFDGEFIARAQDKEDDLRITMAPLLLNADAASRMLEYFHDDGPIAILCAHLIARPSGPHSSDLARLYGLTPAEGALAAAFLEGQTLQSVAEHRGTSIHTVRKQLSSVFEKTGTSQQSQLVALLAKRTV